MLLEGEALTLCCLPAGSPTPRILWMKGGGCLRCLGGWVPGQALQHPSPLLLATDKKSLQPDSGLNVVSCKDGRQMLTIAKVSRKDAGLYECAAANTLGTAISSCTLAVARKEAGVGYLGGQRCCPVQHMPGRYPKAGDWSEQVI